MQTRSVQVADAVDSQLGGELQTLARAGDAIQPGWQGNPQGIDDNLVDPDKVAADLRDGVLRVSLPKQEALKPRKIAVN